MWGREGSGGVNRIIMLIYEGSRSMGGVRTGNSGPTDSAEEGLGISGHSPAAQEAGHDGEGRCQQQAHGRVQCRRPTIIAQAPWFLGGQQQHHGREEARQERGLTRETGRRGEYASVIREGN